MLRDEAACPALSVLPEQGSWGWTRHLVPEAEPVLGAGEQSTGGRVSDDRALDKPSRAHGKGFSFKEMLFRVCNQPQPSLLEGRAAGQAEAPAARLTDLLPASISHQ